MGIKMKFGVLILSAVISLYAIVGGLMPGYGVVANNNDPYSQMTIFHEILTRIVEDYVDEPDLEKVRLGALRGLAEGLDPYSAYLTSDQVRQYISGTEEAPGESGLILSKLSGYVYVVSVLKGSPADQSGIRAGDVIEYINNRASRDLSQYEALGMVRGDVGKEVEIKLFRQSKNVKVKLAALQRPNPTTRLENGGIGYLHVPSLASESTGKLRTELQTLINRGAQKVVLDLRGTADGDFDQGAALANLFISKGTLATLVGKEGKELRSVAAKPEGHLFSGPVVALVDRSTAGGAEIVAAAFVEHKRGDVVGERTFGAGGEQELFRMRDGGGLLITTKKYASPAGQPFMGNTSATSGVKPTVEVRRTDVAEFPTPEELQEEEVQPPDEQTVAKPARTGEDVQLKKALELLREAKN